MSPSLLSLDHDALEHQTRRGQVAGPCQDLHGGILVDRHALTRGERDHVAVGMGPIVQVLRVEEVRGRGRDAGRLRERDAAVQDHIGVHVLHGHEAERGRLAAGEALDRLEAGHVHRPVHVVDHDQVGPVRTTHQLCPQAVPVRLDVRRRRGCATIGSGIEHLVLPERPGGAVDAADDVGRCDRDLLEQTVDLLAAGCRAVRVQATADQVRHRGLADVHAGIQQVDDPLTTGVLELFQAGNGDRAGGLLDGVLGGADDVLRGDRQGLVARVPAGVAVGCERQFLQDDIAAGERLDVAALLEAHQQSIVGRDVVRDLAGTRLDGRGDDVADCCIGECHDGAPT